jgi:hypothetical protein
MHTILLFQPQAQACAGQETALHAANSLLRSLLVSLRHIPHQGPNIDARVDFDD